MMGCPLDKGFPVFPDGFSEEIISAFLEKTGLEGVLCNAPASGTEVLERLGAEHLRTGMPIVYTSADSVFQIAAHEKHFGLERLYEICQIARDQLDPYGLGRVIARPFVGEEGAFQRTYNRRDYSMLPPRETTLDRLKAAGIPVVGVGKIADIFAGRGVTESIHTEGNTDGMQRVIEQAKTLDRGLVFCNLVDFDMLYGHRRDAEGYARALERFDVQCRELETHLRPGDLVILTADHGNDPTNDKNTDHTREYVPVIAFGPDASGAVDLGTRSSFADVGATVEDAFGLSPAPFGSSFLNDLATTN
jgi:phosphopentomutase